MRTVRTSLICLLLMAGILRADMSAAGRVSSSPGFQVAARSWELPSVATCGDFLLEYRTRPSAVEPSDVAGRAASDGFATGVVTGSTDEIKRIPPPPGGESLCLSGLATVGVWQLVRRARLGGASVGWYHADGAGVRHLLVFDPECDLLSAQFPVYALAAFDLPPSLRVLHRAPRVLHLPGGSQRSILCLTAPRGPPANCDTSL